MEGVNDMNMLTTFWETVIYWSQCDIYLMMYSRLLEMCVPEHSPLEKKTWLIMQTLE